MSLPSPSDRLRLDLESPLQGTRLLGVSLVFLHAVTAGIASNLGLAAPITALLLDRPAELRVGVGGQGSAQIAAGEVWRLATSVLLHADVLHLALNVAAIAVLGRLLEPFVGPTRLLAWFVLGGVGGSVVSQVSGVSQSDGASGGAFALLGAALVLGWRWRARWVPEDWRVMGPALWLVLAGNLVLSFALPMVDVSAHVGGLLIGLLVAQTPTGSRWAKADRTVVTVFVVVCVWGWLFG